MFDPIKVVAIDLSEPLNDIKNLEGYKKVHILCKWREKSVCNLTLSVNNNICPADSIIKEIESNAGNELVKLLLTLSLEYGIKLNEQSFSELIFKKKLIEAGEKPLVTVAVCTRNRSEQLKLCLDSIISLDYPNLDLIVIDNAPANNLTKELVENSYPQFRYFCEQRPGLDFARNRAILEANGEIIAFTDDDVVVDKYWAYAIAKTFIEEPGTMAVTGLVEPYELEKKSHLLFELYGGFGRGFKPSWTNIDENSSTRWHHFGTGRYGTGANMAFRKEIFYKVGFFDNALDVGTVTNGGGDLDIFFRVLKFGYTLKYNPDVVVFHRHREEYSKLKKQLNDNGIGFYSYVVKNALAFPEERWQFIKLAIFYPIYWNTRRLLFLSLKHSRLPGELLLTEIFGSLTGLFRYQKACKKLKEVENTFGKIDYNFLHPCKRNSNINREKLFAIRNINLNKKLEPLLNLEEYRFVRVYVTRDGYLLGNFDYQNNFRDININLLKDLLADKIGIKIIEHESRKCSEASLRLKSDFRKVVTKNSPSPSLSKDFPVSIIIGTCDRPEDLKACLISLMEKKYDRKIEIIVVDNNPASGITPAVLKDFPDVKLVCEQRKGVSFARNAGIMAATGNIIVTTDDDVIIHDHWLENMLAPFTRNDVAAVTGNILPFELETHSQFLFELYGGLGEGNEPKEYGPEDFEKYRFLSFPAWDIGATSNSAYRAEIFHNPDIGLFDETLGPGTPTGVGEDTYMFYKILKHGDKIVYNPNAFVWHKHRKTLKSLRKQIYNYSKGHVAYQLTTLFRDKDFRSLTRLFLELPLTYLSRIFKRLRGKSGYTLSLIFLEILGNLNGPIVFLISNIRLKKLKKNEENLKLAGQKIKPETAYKIL